MGLVAKVRRHTSKSSTCPSMLCLQEEEPLKNWVDQTTKTAGISAPAGPPAPAPEESAVAPVTEEAAPPTAATEAAEASEPAPVEEAAAEAEAAPEPDADPAEDEAVSEGADTKEDTGVDEEKNDKAKGK